MPPKGRKAASNKAGDDDQATSQTQQPATEPLKVCIHDPAAIKSALDDCAREVVIESGYDEDTTTSNVKIFIGIVVIAIALYAQFGPGKFPATWWPVFWCVAAYVVLSSGLNLYLHRYEADSFLICKARKNAPHGLRLSSCLERFDDQYTLVMSLGLKRHAEYREVKLKTPFSKFFHRDGFFSEPAFKPLVESLLSSFEATAIKKTQ